MKGGGKFKKLKFVFLFQKIKNSKIEQKSSAALQ
jgi:hypothetical protein